MTDREVPETGFRQTGAKRTERGETDTQGRSRKAPHGGYSAEVAARHLRNFYADAEPDERDQRYFRTTRELVVVARRWRKLANDRIKAIGQNMARWETLYLMACSDEELSQGELATVVGVKGPTMVHMLNSLERDGLIERYQSALDKRITHNRITPKGEQATRDIMAITNDLRAEVLRDIDSARLDIAVEVLEAIHAKLDDLS